MAPHRRRGRTITQRNRIGACAAPHVARRPDQNIGDCAASLGSLDPAGCRPFMMRPTMSGASSVSRGEVPSCSRSVRSALAIPVTDWKRPQSNSFCHRNARASAFASVVSAR